MSAVSDISRISMSVKVVYLCYSCPLSYQLSLDYLHEKSFPFSCSQGETVGHVLMNVAHRLKKKKPA